MTRSQQQAVTDAITAVQRAVAEVQDEAMAIGMSIQITMDLLRTVDPAERPRVGEALVRIATNNLCIEEAR